MGFEFVFYLVCVCFLVGRGNSLDFVTENNLDTSLQVKINNGLVQGTQIVNREDGQTFCAYFGMPYAVPPVNNLRFRDPKRFNKTWTGVFDATKEGSPCVEFMFYTKNWNVSGNEDCLYLNVYTPKNPKKIGTPLPVMVWIYGGAFREGNSKFNFYGPDYFLKGNVIVVSFNYRIGTLGFLNTEDLESPGNYGLKDQNLALKWVSDNIQYFGGDNKRVTIFGESAGSASVAYHLLSEKSAGLFHKAILESGTSLNSWGQQLAPRKIAFQFGMALGIETKSSKKLMKELRRIDIVKLKPAIPRVFAANIPVLGGQVTFAPSIEPNHGNAFFTKHSYVAFQNGNFSKVPLMVGINSQETNLFRNLLETARPYFFLTDLSPQMLVTPATNIKATANRREFGTCILKQYFKSGSFGGCESEELAEYFSDDQFVRPITKVVKFTSSYTPVYFYVFSYEGSLGKASVKRIFHINRDKYEGSAHSEELFYLWKSRRLNFGNPSDADKEMTKIMAKLWTNFAKYGNPTPSKDKILQHVLWPTANLRNNYAYLSIDKKLKINKNYKKENMDFWDSLYQKYSDGPMDTF